MKDSSITIHDQVKQTNKQTNKKKNQKGGEEGVKEDYWDFGSPDL